MSIADKLTTIAENEQKVYDAGAENVEKILTNGGERNYYYNFFRQCEFEYPPFYPQNIVNARAMFYECKNLKEINGLDLSKATSADDMFVNTTSIEKILNSPMPKVASMPYIFSNSGVKEINPLNVSGVGIEAYRSNNSFYGCKNLTTVVMEGTISFSMDIHWSPLSKASIVSIINALSTTTSGLTLTLSKSAVNTAFGINVDDETTYPEGSEYYTLRHSKDNWAISYLDA